MSPDNKASLDNKGSLDNMDGTGVPRTLSAIPLSDPNVTASGDASIGALVKDATTQLSSLVRSEVELAKAEVVGEAKKALTGSIFFIVAATVLLYSSFFFFFFLAELLDTWIWRWLAFAIVFLLMVAIAALAAVLGYLKVRKIRGPQKTIALIKETPDIFDTGSAGKATRT